MATIQELLLLGKETLQQSGNEYAKYERKVLLEEVLGQNYMYMLMNGEEEVSAKAEQRYLEFLERRCTHYPLQYLLGYAHFMDYTFYVDENVLIPRNDTEVLVEFANEVIEGKKPDDRAWHVLDLCCGSGCIGISLKLYHKEIDLTLSDLSEAALAVTKRNLERHGLCAEVVCGDLLQGIREKMNLIVCNPPYIERDVIDTLMPEVKEYEPVLALDGGEDGLDFYRRIAADSPDYLEKQGWLILEIGYDQGETVSRLLREHGFLEVAVKKDYAGLDRVVYGHL